MTNKLLSLTAGAALLALSNTAYAQQPVAAPAKHPVALSDQQMDKVSAGSVAIGQAAAVALGELFSDTFTQTSTNANKTGPALTQIVIGQSQSWAISAGVLYQAFAVSHADSSAVW
jgi:hypothetical protein